MKKWLIIYIVSALPFTCALYDVHAGDFDRLGIPISLIEDIRQRNPLILSAFHEWQAQQHQVIPAKSLDDPQLTIALSNYPVDSLRGDESAMTGNEIRLSQAIPYPGKRDQRGQSAQEQANAAEARYLDLIAQNEAQGRRDYYTLWFLDRSRQRIEDELVEITTLIRLGESRYRSGLESQAAVVEAQLTASRLREQLIQLQQEQREQLALLNQLRSQPAAYPLTIPTELPQTLLPDNDDWWRQVESSAKTHSPRARQYQALIRRAEHQQILAELDRYPDFTVGLSYRQRQATAMDDGTDFVGAEIRFNLPIFHNKQREQIASAQSQQSAAVGRWHQDQNRIQQQIYDLRTQLQSTYQRDALYRSAILPQAELSYRSRLAAYENDLESFSNVLRSLEIWWEHRQNKDAVRRDHQVAVATLVELTGDALLTSLAVSTEEKEIRP
nr:TolC family protein [uncultured Desulfuromonas sp.]